MHSRAGYSLRDGEPEAKSGVGGWGKGVFLFQSGPVTQYPSEVNNTDPDPSREQRQALRYISVTRRKELGKVYKL